VTIQGAYAGGMSMLDQIKAGGAVDVFIVGTYILTPEAQKFFEPAVPAYDLHIVLAVSRTPAVKITSIQDIAKPGVRLVWGTPGSGMLIWENRVADSLGKLYGAGFVAKMRANNQVLKTSLAKFTAAIDAGAADAAFVFSPDIDANETKLELPPEAQLTLSFVVAPVKASAHAAAAREFASYLTGADAKQAYLRHGYTPH
jgi:ABC-type molybdate transport system substrate-binding protein